MDRGLEISYPASCSGFPVGMKIQRSANEEKIGVGGAVGWSGRSEEASGGLV